MLNLGFSILAGLLSLCACADIREFGAISGDSSDATATVNSAAILKAILAANASSTDRTVLVPAGLNFTVFNTSISNVNDVTLQIDGVLVVSNNISNTNWVNNNGGAVLYWQQCSGIEITGGGFIDGQGYWWWWYVIFTGHDSRPHLIIMYQCTDILIHNVGFYNSPQYHMLLEDILNVVVRDLIIHVDVEDQKALLSSKGLLKDGIPTFPLNTDGIDPSGANVLIDNVTIQNFDDAVAVKPMHSGGMYSTCSHNMTITNSRVSLGVGMTIGSVPPNGGVNCVRDILFQNINFTQAIKALYIKSNPGTSGTGIINNITYRNINVEGSLWYPIWIGPQQQQQSPSLLTAPLRVTISNITLEDVTFSGGLTLPGVFLCDPANPCTGFNFINVQNTGPFLIQQDYVCQSAGNDE